MTSNINLPTLGSQAVVTIAMLQDLQSMPNRAGDTRLGANNTGMGKKAGARYLVNMGANTTVLDGEALSMNMYKEVIALGARSSDAYIDVSLGTTLLAPVNIKDPDNSASTWTIATH